jgi:hypothetical protein
MFLKYSPELFIRNPRRCHWAGLCQAFSLAKHDTGRRRGRIGIHIYGNRGSGIIIIMRISQSPLPNRPPPPINYRNLISPLFS